MHDASRPMDTRSSPASRDARSSAHFDAGDRGCGDGLAKELRQRLEAIAVGDSLTVVVRDPSAKVDVPSVARMLGHRVLSEEPFADGRLVITLERGNVRETDL